MSVDAGYVGPGVSWFLYANVLLAEAVGLSTVFRRREWLEPACFALEGLLISILHVPVIIACEAEQDPECSSRNWLHFFAGLFIFSSAASDLVLNSSYLRNSYRQTRHKEVKSGALTLLPPRFGVPFIFCVVGVMMLFKQSAQESMYRAVMHQAVGLLSVVTGFLRFFSYRNPQLTMPTAVTCLWTSIFMATSGQRAFQLITDSAHMMAHQWIFVVVGSVAFYVLGGLVFAGWWRIYTERKYGEFREILHDEYSGRAGFTALLVAVSVFIFLIIADELV
mmetsp:Transcript_41546/g.104776  ORF Transcript_41546/g.104776 Transcript_41546/m.104776 type:complete len:279 (+) Transcript_41546:100-936(+)